MKAIRLLPLLLTLISTPSVAQELKWSPPRKFDLTPVSRTARIQPGDSLASFLNRHGVTRDELKLLNPGIQLSALTVGMELKLPIDSNGNLSSQEQRVLDRLNSNKQRKEEQKRRAFAADQKRWGKCYGYEQYDWMGWKRAANGTWVTDKRFCHRYSTYSTLPPPKPNYLVAVTCKGLRVSTLWLSAIEYTDTQWSEWKEPTPSEEEMIVKLCSREET